MTENKDDLISREALKKAIMFKDNANAETWEQLYDSVLEEIDNAPTVEQKYYERVIAQINPVIEARPQGEWIVTAEDSEGIHRIQCPFCGYEKGSDFIDYITVTFEKFPPFCESCGASMGGNKK